MGGIWMLVFEFFLKLVYKSMKKSMCRNDLLWIRSRIFYDLLQTDQLHEKPPARRGDRPNIDVSVFEFFLKLVYIRACAEMIYYGLRGRKELAMLRERST